MVDKIVWEKIHSLEKEVAELVAGAMAAVFAETLIKEEDMITNSELKLQCMRMACEVMGVYNVKSEKPLAEEVIAEAEKVYKWIRRK